MQTRRRFPVFLLRDAKANALTGFRSRAKSSGHKASASPMRSPVSSHTRTAKAFSGMSKSSALCSRSSGTKSVLIVLPSGPLNGLQSPKGLAPQALSPSFDYPQNVNSDFRPLKIPVYRSFSAELSTEFSASRQPGSTPQQRPVSAVPAHPRPAAARP